MKKTEIIELLSYLNNLKNKEDTIEGIISKINRGEETLKQTISELREEKYLIQGTSSNKLKISITGRLFIIKFKHDDFSNTIIVIAAILSLFIATLSFLISLSI